MPGPVSYRQPDGPPALCVECEGIPPDAAPGVDGRWLCIACDQALRLAGAIERSGMKTEGVRVCARTVTITWPAGTRVTVRASAVGRLDDLNRPPFGVEHEPVLPIDHEG